MGPKEREIKRRLRVLEHAGKIGNVRMTCRYFGLARSWPACLWEIGSTPQAKISSRPILKMNSPPAQE